MLTRLLPHLPTWRRALRRRRRTLAVLVVAAAAVLLVPSLVPASVTGTKVVVAAEDLPTGTALEAEQMRTVEVASSLVPSGAATAVEDLVGERLAAPVAADGPILSVDLLATGEDPLPEGTALLAVPVPEVLLPHLRSGTRIELLMSDPVDGSATRIPAEIRSLSPATGTGALGTGTDAGVQALVLVDRQRSGEVAHALGTSNVAVSVIR
ncbi:SAF domain-containing protein [Brachybacterium paraconglomeratum]|uniref:SAF domain-containing protein n=1 Tax=Brachybacterium paraconglomeratum TaxID=173362 RepID=UPI003F7B8D8C